jgi:hypothetical protein
MRFGAKPWRPDPENAVEMAVGIVAAIGKRTHHLSPDQKIWHVYNEAIDDACDFVQTLARRNPEHRLAFESLAVEMRALLPLVEIPQERRKETP